MILDRFCLARPVWAREYTEEMNITLVFSSALPAGEKTLAIAGASSWQIFYRGAFLAAGPARTAHGYARIDRIPLPPEEGVLTIRVAGYHTNSFYLLDIPPFLCAEITAGESVLAATGASGFTAVRDGRRVQRVQRYSFQRPFAETYDLGADASLPVTLCDVEPPVFLTREVPYPDYEETDACVTESGYYSVVPRESYFDNRAMHPSPSLKCFAPDDWTVSLTRDAWECEFSLAPCENTPSVTLPAFGAATADFGRELTGFLRLEIESDGGRLLVTFDEILRNGHLDSTRSGTCNVLSWHLTPGTHTLLTAEPYSLRYLRLAAEGGIRVRRISLVRYEFPAAPLVGIPHTEDSELACIRDAAVSTFRQNTLDIYMDCPSRERAGWLCDSFFTARVEYALTEKTAVEHAFLENFLLPDSFACLPEGMLPMCYPSDHYDGNFIPNWAMWYVLELEEYIFLRGGDRAILETAKPRLDALLAYFRTLENADGLLEKLQGWVFLEWSRSNELTQDINFPSNMLYARFKRALAHLYGDESLLSEAEALEETIRRRSFTGTFFSDNEVYRDGTPVLSGECTESCQYYAFFTGVATREMYPALWETLVRDFGPDRAERGLHPNVAPANAFIGNYLRLEILWNAGLRAQVLKECRGYFGYMARRTGTLWENVDDYASCNHGFASHVLIWLGAGEENR